jgi:hypothetical protein
MAVRARERERLLADFDGLIRRVRPFVVERYGEASADALVRAARAKYEAIVPRVPHIPGVRARIFNQFLRGTAQEIAVYQAVSERGGTPAEAWEICHEGTRLTVAAVPRWKRWLLRRFMFSRLVHWIVKRRQARGETVRFGEFEVRYLASDGTDFDIGVDYVRCGNLELARKLGAEPFAPYVCMSDVALSDGLGWGLIRTQTLADGCSHCDFRFKKNGETRISSKTPEVQETIDGIARRETRVAGAGASWATDGGS